MGPPVGLWFTGYGVVTKGNVIRVDDGVGKGLMTWRGAVTTFSCHLMGREEGRGKERGEERRGKERGGRGRGGEREGKRREEGEEGEGGESGEREGR